MADGVDYVPLPKWKIFLIQFLNIAGLGPIFGAVAGAMWGPVAFPFSSYFSLYIAIGANAQRNPKKKTRKDRATLSTNLHLAHPGPCTYMDPRQRRMNPVRRIITVRGAFHGLIVDRKN